MEAGLAHHVWNLEEVIGLLDTEGCTSRVMWYQNRDQWLVIWIMALGWTALSAATQQLGAFVFALLIDGALLIWKLQNL